MTSTNEYPSCFVAKEYGLETWPAFAVVKLPASGNEVCRNLRVKVMVVGVGDLVADCMWMCLYSDVHLRCNH